MLATDWDHKVIDGTSVALGGIVGQPDDVQRLLGQVQATEPKERERVLAEIAIAFARYAQDLKHKLIVSG